MFTDPRHEQFILLFPECPSGDHPGAVRAYSIGGVKSFIPYPLEFQCGCKDPR